MQDFINVNRKAWDQKVSIHMASDFYDVNGFIQGDTSLRKLEIPLLLPFEGQRILHAQCHFGMDTLSMERMGMSATGVDFSEEAIKQAKILAKQVKLSSNFICDDVLTLEKVPDQSFDLVYSSYGVVGWLNDLTKWASNLFSKLRSGGSLLLVDFHPFIWTLDDDFKGFYYDYFKGDPIVEQEEFTYTDDKKETPLNAKTISWNHSLSEIFQALRKAGFIVTDFDEYDYSPYPCFPHLKKRAEQEYIFEHIQPRIPMVYHIRAEKK